MFRTYIVTAFSGGFLFIAANASFAAIDVNESFSPATALSTQVTRVQIRLFNSSLFDSFNVALSDVLPDGVFIAARPYISNSCDDIIIATNNADNGGIDLIESQTFRSCG